MLGASLAWTASAAAAVPDDPGFGQQFGLHNAGQLVGGTAGAPDADVDAPEAWDLTTGSPAVTVAMVDDGIDPGQADLAPSLVAGYDFANGDPDPTESGSDHGSQTATVLGARGNNGIGTAGVNWTVSIMPLKVRADGTGERFELISPTAVADAFRYAGSRGVRIVNASFGLRSSTTGAERAAVLTAINGSPSTLFVVSAGNSGADNDAQPRYPCNFDVPNLICVAASDQSDGLWASSNFGATSVDLAAPGVKTYAVTGRNAYGLVDGTSYAAPLVSGVAALYLSRYPAASAADLRRAILGGAEVRPALAGKTVTGGRLNAAATLAISPAPTAPPPPPPSPAAPPPPPGTDPGRGAIAVRMTRRQKLSTVLRRGVRVSVTVPVAVRMRVVLRISSTLARRLRMSTVIGSASVRRSSGNQSVRVHVRSSARRRLRTQRRVSVAVTVGLTARRGASPGLPRSTRRSVLLLRALGRK